MRNVHKLLVLPALAVLAASMQPGTWAKLAAGSQDAVLGVGSVSGTMIHYCNSMPWNPVSKASEIIGQDHSYPSLRHVRYVEATNQFTLVADNAGRWAADEPVLICVSGRGDKDVAQISELGLVEV